MARSKILLLQIIFFHTPGATGGLCCSREKDALWLYKLSVCETAESTVVRPPRTGLWQVRFHIFLCYHVVISCTFSSDNVIPQRRGPLSTSQKDHFIDKHFRRRRSFSLAQATTGVFQAGFIGLMTIFAVLGLLVLGCAVIRRHLSTTTSASYARSICRLCDGDHSRMAYLSTRVRSLELQLGIGGAPLYDYALRGAGAFIIRELTSPTIGDTAIPGRFDQSMAVMTPIVVIEDSLVSGDCWEFSGSTGHVAMFFAIPINITDMTVHYPRSLPPLARLQAPRDITLWGLETTQNPMKTHQYPRSRQAATFLTAGTLSHSYMDVSDYFSPILTAEFKASHPHYGVQRFTRSSYGESLYRVVVIEITSNWGADSTCVYHVGVHGWHTVQGSK